MLCRTGSICFAFSLVALAAACGSGPEDISNTAGAAGMAGTTPIAGGAAVAGNSTASSGAGGMPSNGGTATTAGTTSSAGQTTAGGHAGSAGNSTLGGAGGSGGSSQSGGGKANGGGPASTEGLAFSGSCLNAAHCTDEWDVTFGAAALEEICTAQQGTWSTGHCATASWKKKCTQSVFGGVYVQYLPADGICAAGFEEAL